MSYTEFKRARDALYAALPAADGDSAILDGHEIVPGPKEPRRPTVRWCVMLDGHEYVVALLPRITVHDDSEVLPPHVRAEAT